MNIGIILYVYSVWFAYPVVSSIFSCHPVMLALLSPASKAGSSGVSSHAIRDRMRAHRSVQVAGHKSLPNVHTSAAAPSAGDATIPTFNDLRKGSVVTVEWRS